MKTINLLLVIFFLLPLSVLAQGNTFGAADYLSQGVGSRAAGMGNAYLALADDATAGYWNPAGLARMGVYRYQLASQYAFLENDMFYNYLAYAFQWPDVGAFAVSWINSGVGNIEGRDEYGALTRDFSSAENAFLFSYGRNANRLVKGISFGTTVKVLHHQLDTSTAWGYGLDMAILWQPLLYKEHTLGLVVQNIGQQMHWDTGTIDSSLLRAGLGGAMKFFPSSTEIYFHHLILTTDFLFSEYSRFEPRIGTEYWIIEQAAIRAGWEKDVFTAGASYQESIYGVNYAFRYDLSELSFHQHRISIAFRFK